MHSQFAKEYLSVNCVLTFTTIIVFILCLAKDLSKFAILGQFAVASVCYLVLVLFLQSFVYFDIQNIQKVNLIDFDFINICTSFTGVLFALNSVLNIFSSVNIVNRPTDSRINKMAYNSNVSLIVI